MTKCYKIKGSVNVNPFIKKEKAEEEIIKDFMKKVNQLAQEQNLVHITLMVDWDD